MQLGEAFTRLGSLSPEERREVLADQFANVILRGVAALLIADHRDLALDHKVCWLLKSWESAPLEVRKYILEALGHCASPQSIAFLKEKLSDPDLRLDAINALATLSDQDILPVCEELVRAGTESECRSALKALSALGSYDSTAVVVAALQSSPFESCRQWAAYLLALNGLKTGESLLEERLSSLQPLRVESQESASQERLGIEPDYLLTAIALSWIKNKNGLIALEQLLDTLESNQNVDRQFLFNMTLGIVGMSATTSFEEWKVVMQQWIDERLRPQSPA